MASESSLSWTDLQKYDKVRLWQSHVRLLAPVKTETLRETSTSDHLSLLSQNGVKDAEFGRRRMLNKVTHRLGAGESNSREGVPVYHQSGALLQLPLH